MEFTSRQAELRYAALARDAAGCVVGLDFDGTLSPIVEDPDEARIHPDAADVLVELARVVPAIAVITGRPARQVVELGDLDRLGDEIARLDTLLHVFGQYGNEHWTSTERRVVAPRPPAGLATVMRELPAVLAQAGAADAYVEEKGLAVAVHTRRLDDPAGALGRLLLPLRDLAARNELVLEPGRSVIEVRSAGMHKGMVVHRLAEFHAARGFVFAGDDLGDVEAFNAVDDLRAEGLSTLLACSASDEQSALANRADVVVPGPAGVLDLLRRLTRDARAEF